MGIPSVKDEYYLYHVDGLGIYVNKNLTYSKELLYVLLENLLKK